MEAYAAILKNPIGSFGYFFLIVTFLSLWINRKIWIWLPLFAIGFLLCFWSGNVNVMALIPIGVLALCHGILTRDIGSFFRLFVVMIAAIVSFGLIFHFIKGFQNIQLLSGWYMTKDATPMSLYLNFDKPLIGLFVLTFTLPLIQTSRQLAKVLAAALPWGIMTVVILMGLGNYLGIVIFDPKIPSITLLWLFINLFLVTIPEEAFFRGFLVKEIATNLKNSFSGILAIVVVALLHALTYLLYMPDFTFFLATFVASILYGGIFIITGAIESAIIVHYMVNIIHFFFFTYPMLQSAY